MRKRKWLSIILFFMLISVVAPTSTPAGARPVNDTPVGTTTGSNQPQSIVSHWEGSLTPNPPLSQSSENDAAAVGSLSFDLTYDANNAPIQLTYQITATHATINGDGQFVCYNGGTANLQSDADNVLPTLPGFYVQDFNEVSSTAFFGSWSFFGLSGRGTGLPGDIGLDNAEGSLQLNYHAPGTPQWVGDCTWAWQATCTTNCIAGPARLLFSQATVNVREDTGEATVAVTRNGNRDDEVTVDYATSNGTATAGQDYTVKSGTLTFPSGVYQKTFTVPILENDPIEGLEDINLTLSNPTNGAQLGTQSTAKIIIDDRPDLFMNGFTLSPSQLAQEGTQYVMKDIEITVGNVAVDGPTVPSTLVRMTNGADMVYEKTVGPLAPGATTSFKFDWDVTDLIVAGKGAAELILAARVDPDNAIPEMNEANNSDTASSSVDARPVILSLQPKYTLAGQYFLDNTDLSNEIKVTVDWNGDLLPGTGSTPGQVLFDLNGIEVSVPGQSWGASHTYNMGGDFESSLTCANNTLQIWASMPSSGGDLESLRKTLQPTVFPFPAWAEWAIQNIPGSDATFAATPKVPIVEYAYNFKYPEPPFEAIWTVPDPVPYFGGEDIGIQATQASASALGRSSGSGTVGVSGQTGLDVATFNIGGQVWGKGDVVFVCAKSLDLKRAQLGFSIHSTIAREMGLAELIPALAAAESWPVTGGAIKWINDTAMVEGSMTPEIQIQTEFEEVNDQLDFVAGEGTGSIATSAALSVEPIDGLMAQVSGGGTPYVTIQTPANPSYLKEVGIDLFFEALFQAWQFETSYRRDVNCNYPGGCSAAAARYQSSETPSIEPTWQLIPRDYAGADYAAFTHLTYRADQEIGTAITNTETTLVTNIYPRPEPTLAVRSDGQRVVAYVHDDTSKPQGRGTEIRALIWNGSSWNAPTNLTGDQQPDFAPAVTFDGNGNGVLVWERSTLPVGITPTLDITFAQSLEIFARTGNGTAFDNEINLSNNSLMDHAPRLSTGTDGTVMALWQTSDGTDTLGTAGHPLSYTYSVWDGNAWSAPAPALTGLQNVIKSSFAVYSATQATLVYVQDTSGTLDNTRAELYYSTFNGTNWSAPARLTNDLLPDIAPALAYDAAGDLHLAWLRNGNLVWLKNSWDVNQAQTVRSASTGGGFLGFTLNRAPNGNLALVWQAMGADGADLTYRIYDVTTGTWGADQTLTAGSEVEASHSPAFASDGSLYLAYQKITTEFVTRTITISPTLSYTVTNLPEAGQSDLAFLEHTVGRDLTFDSFTISPTNPAPGLPVTLTAVLHNDGDLTVVGPQVAFYDGSALIDSVQTLADLGGGYTTTVQMNWTVPVSNTTHTLKATADPNGQVSESDETNNEITLATVLPDLAVDVLYTSYSSDALTVTVRLSNTGVLTASAPFSVTLRATDPLTGTLLATATVTQNVAAGSRVTVTQTITDVASLAGLGDALWAYADAGDGVTEADETNNTEFTALNVLPDLTLAAGDILDLAPNTIAVHNSGFVTATNVVVTARDGSISGTLLYSATLPAVVPGGMGVLTPTISPGTYTLFARADAVDAIAELDESNNLAVRIVTIKRMNIYLPLIHKQ